jgi:hypothetical protein
LERDDAGIDDAINDFDVKDLGAGANFQAGSVVIVVDGRTIWG